MKYQYWLSNIPGVGCKTIHRLLGQAGSAEEIYFLKKEQLEKLSGLSDRQVHAITDRKKNWDLEEKNMPRWEKTGSLFCPVRWSHILNSSGISWMLHTVCTSKGKCLISQKEEWRSSGRECARNTERKWQNRSVKNWRFAGRRF